MCGGHLKHNLLLSGKKNLHFSFPIKMNNFNNDPLIFLSVFLCDPSCYLQNTIMLKRKFICIWPKRLDQNFLKTTWEKSWMYVQPRAWKSLEALHRWRMAKKVSLKSWLITCSPLRLARASWCRIDGESLGISESAFIRFFFCSLPSASS